MSHRVRMYADPLGYFFQIRRSHAYLMIVICQPVPSSNKKVPQSRPRVATF
jgi:hypothetical protein